MHLLVGFALHSRGLDYVRNFVSFVFFAYNISLLLNECCYHIDMKSREMNGPVPLGEEEET